MRLADLLSMDQYIGWAESPTALHGSNRELEMEGRPHTAVQTPKMTPEGTMESLHRHWELKNL